MAPILLEELKTAISQGKPNKAPGVDGIGSEFYIMGWDIFRTELLQIMNIMYSEEQLRCDTQEAQHYTHQITGH